MDQSNTLENVERAMIRETLTRGCEYLLRTPTINGYAQAYAKSMLDLLDGRQAFDPNGHAIAVQIDYILSNLSDWRGETARSLKKTFKEIKQLVQSNPDHWKY